MTEISAGLPATGSSTITAPVIAIEEELNDSETLQFSDSDESDESKATEPTTSSSSSSSTRPAADTTSTPLAAETTDADQVDDGSGLATPTRDEDDDISQGIASEAEVVPTPDKTSDEISTSKSEDSTLIMSQPIDGKVDNGVDAPSMDSPASNDKEIAVETADVIDESEMVIAIDDGAVDDGHNDKTASNDTTDPRVDECDSSLNPMLLAPDSSKLGDFTPAETKDDTKSAKAEAESGTVIVLSSSCDDDDDDEEIRLLEDLPLDADASSVKEAVADVPKTLPSDEADDVVPRIPEVTGVEMRKMSTDDGDNHDEDSMPEMVLQIPEAADAKKLKTATDNGYIHDQDSLPELVPQIPEAAVSKCLKTSSDNGDNHDEDTLPELVPQIAEAAVEDKHKMTTDYGVHNDEDSMPELVSQEAENHASLLTEVPADTEAVATDDEASSAVEWSLPDSPSIDSAHYKPAIDSVDSNESFLDCLEENKLNAVDSKLTKKTDTAVDGDAERATMPNEDMEKSLNGSTAMTFVTATQSTDDDIFVDCKTDATEASVEASLLGADVIASNDVCTISPQVSQCKTLAGATESFNMTDNSKTEDVAEKYATPDDVEERTDSDASGLDPDIRQLANDVFGSDLSERSTADAAEVAVDSDDDALLMDADASQSSAEDKMKKNETKSIDDNDDDVAVVDANGSATSSLTEEKMVQDNSTEVDDEDNADDVTVVDADGSAPQTSKEEKMVKENATECSINADDDASVVDSSASQSSTENQKLKNNTTEAVDDDVSLVDADVSAPQTSTDENMVKENTTEVDDDVTVVDADGNAPHTSTEVKKVEENRTEFSINDEDDDVTVVDGSASQSLPEKEISKDNAADVDDDDVMTVVEPNGIASQLSTEEKVVKENSTEISIDDDDEDVTVLDGSASQSLTEKKTLKDDHNDSLEIVFDNGMLSEEEKEKVDSAIKPTKEQVEKTVLENAQDIRVDSAANGDLTSSDRAKVSSRVNEVFTANDDSTMGDGAKVASSVNGGSVDTGEQQAVAVIAVAAPASEAPGACVSESVICLDDDDDDDVVEHVVGKAPTPLIVPATDPLVVKDDVATTATIADDSAAASANSGRADAQSDDEFMLSVAVARGKPIPVDVHFDDATKTAATADPDTRDTTEAPANEQATEPAEAAATATATAADAGRHSPEATKHKSTTDLEEPEIKRVCLAGDDEVGQRSNDDISTTPTTDATIVDDDEVIIVENGDHVNSDKVAVKRPSGQLDESSDTDAPDSTTAVSTAALKKKAKLLSESEADTNASGAGDQSPTPAAGDIQLAGPRSKYLRKFHESLEGMTRDDLEHLIIAKVSEAILHKTELADMRQRLHKMLELNTSYRRTIEASTKLMRDLEMVNDRVVKDMQAHNKSVVVPVRITRAVGLQVNLSRRDAATSQTATASSVASAISAAKRSASVSSGSGSTTPPKQVKLLPKLDSPKMKSELTVSKVRRVSVVSNAALGLPANTSMASGQPQSLPPPPLVPTSSNYTTNQVSVYEAALSAVSVPEFH